MNTKLSPYFMLCPISDTSKLQGVAKHPESDCIVVTSSRNMISRYKVAEQRPLSSWSSKDAFQGASHFDEPTSLYVAIVASNQIKVWGETDTKIDRLKKYIFTNTIWDLVLGPEGKVYIVFEGGHTLPLQQALDERKQNFDSFLPENCIIQQCYVLHVQEKLQVILVCLLNEKFPVLLMKELREDAVLQEVKLYNEGLVLKGYTVCVRNRKLTMLSLWSNGVLYSQLVPDDESPGQVIGQVEGVQADKKVALLSLSNTHVAVYAADANDEGATVAVYNTQFCLVQSKLRLKLYTSPPQMWGPFDSKLILASSGHLLVVPYVLGHETLASMMGSANKKKLTNKVQHPSWGERTTSEILFYSSAPSNLQASLDSMTKQGFTEAVICQKLLPILIEKKDVCGILWFLENFKEIPENILARLVSFCLREKETTFDVLHAPSVNPPSLDDEVMEEEPMDEISACLPLESPLGGGRLKLLNGALNIPFNCSRLLPELRNHLAPQDAMLVVRHAASRLWHGDTPQKDTEAQVTQLIQWCCVMLDANYQHCLLSMDTEVLHTLTTLSDIVDTQISNIDELRNLESLIKRMKDGHHLPTSKSSDPVYCIETISIY